MSTYCTTLTQLNYTYSRFWRFVFYVWPVLSHLQCSVWLQSTTTWLVYYPQEAHLLIIVSEGILHSHPSPQGRFVTKSITCSVLRLLTWCANPVLSESRCICLPFRYAFFLLLLLLWSIDFAGWITILEPYSSKNKKILDDMRNAFKLRNHLI